VPEHLKALVVILGAAAAVFWLAERSLCALTMTVADYRRRRNLWFGITLIGFLSHNFWIYIVLAAALLAVGGSRERERNPLALYCLLLFALPPYDKPIPGFGLINYVFDINHVRLLNLVVLLPVALRLYGERNARTAGSFWPDILVAAYIVYRVGMQAMVDSLTGDMRATFYLLVDIWLPYYATSRFLRSIETFRETAASFVLAVAVMAAIAAFEVARSWLVYTSLRLPWEVGIDDLSVYILRGEGGLLRANVAVGNSIVLGYVMMVAIALMIFIGPQLRSRPMLLLGTGTLVAGLVAALSRGPWVGTAVAMIVGIGIGPGGVKRLARIGAISGLLFGVLLVSPYGGAIIDHLPFVGTVDEGSVTYRQRLFEVSMMVLWQNPMFGAFDYILNPAMEQMRQGQGIIDIVNTYLAIALGYGLIGLSLFVFPFLYALVATYLAHRRAARLDVDADRLGRSLLAAMVGIMITIATVSSITVVPTVYWLMLGLCIAYTHSRFALTRPKAVNAPWVVEAPTRRVYPRTIS